jgi:hypothetical protein
MLKHDPAGTDLQGPGIIPESQKYESPPEGGLSISCEAEAS